MVTEIPISVDNGINNGTTRPVGEKNFGVKTGLARMLKGGVIMDVVNVQQVGHLYINDEGAKL